MRGDLFTGTRRHGCGPSTLCPGVGGRRSRWSREEEEKEEKEYAEGMTLNLWSSPDR